MTDKQIKPTQHYVSSHHLAHILSLYYLNDVGSMSA